MNHFHGSVAVKPLEYSIRLLALLFAFKKLFAAKEMTMAKRKNFIIGLVSFFFWSVKLKSNGLKINGSVRKLLKRLAPYLKIISPEWFSHMTFNIYMLVLYILSIGLFEMDAVFMWLYRYVYILRGLTLFRVWWYLHTHTRICGNYSSWMDTFIWMKVKLNASIRLILVFDSQKASIVRFRNASNFLSKMNRTTACSILFPSHTLTHSVSQYGSINNSIKFMRLSIREYLLFNMNRR